MRILIIGLDGGYELHVTYLQILFSINISFYIEKLEPDPRRLPRHDGHLHSSGNPMRIREHLRGLGRQHAANQLPGLSFHRYTGWRTFVLASPLQ